jgi:hypothetical protein
MFYKGPTFTDALANTQLYHDHILHRLQVMVSCLLLCPISGFQASTMRWTIFAAFYALILIASAALCQQYLDPKYASAAAVRQKDDSSGTTKEQTPDLTVRFSVLQILLQLACVGYCQQCVRRSMDMVTRILGASPST